MGRRHARLVNSVCSITPIVGARLLGHNEPPSKDSEGPREWSNETDVGHVSRNRRAFERAVVCVRARPAGAHGLSCAMYVADSGHADLAASPPDSLPPRRRPPLRHRFDHHPFTAVGPMTHARAPLALVDRPEDWPWSPGAPRSIRRTARVVAAENGLGRRLAHRVVRKKNQDPRIKEPGPSVPSTDRLPLRFTGVN